MEGLVDTLLEDATLQRNSIGSEMVLSNAEISAKQGKKKKGKGGKNLNDLAHVDHMEDVTLQRDSIGSEMVCSDTVVSAEQGKKKKRKRKKNSNPLVNVDPMEDVILQRNSIGSEVVQSDTGTSAEHGEKKKKKKKRGENLNSLANVNLIQQPVNGTGIMTDSRLEQPDGKVEDCDNILKTSSGNLSLSNDNNINGRDSGLIVDNRSTLGVKFNQVPEANVTPVSMVVERNDQVCANNGSKGLSLDAPLAEKKTKRKKGQKNLSVLSSNDVHLNGLNSPSINNSSLNNELSQLATTSTGLVVDSKLMLRGSELGLSVESLKEMHQSTCASNGKISCVEGEPVADLKSTQEVDTKPFSKVVESDNQACTGTISISQGLNIGAMHTNRKKKKGRAKNQISQTSNVELHDNLKSVSMVSEISICNNLVQHPVVDTCLMTGSEEVQHVAKLGQLDNIDKGNREKSTKMNAETTPEAAVDPIHKVAGDGDLACGVDISGKMVMVPLQTQKTKRKKKKKNLSTLESSVIMPCTPVMGNSKLIQHSTEQRISDGIHQNECATKDKNCGGDDSSGLIDAKVDEISVSQEKALDNMHGGKKRKGKIRGNNKHLEPEEGVISSNVISEELQDKRATLNANQNVGIGRMFTGFVKRKLLVFDLNGLLVDVVGDGTVTIEADGQVAGKKIFKRPFCEDFLQFCFNRFTVGVWSSRRKENVDKVLQVLMQGEDRSKLAFVWNQNHCTWTNFTTLDKIGKPLFLKELSKLWDKKNRSFPWEVGYYDKSNTLLLDDSPYKALLNPPDTAIFPTPYQYQDQNDNALGPGGDLRVYLEGLALAKSVQEYVKHNPFGQKAITGSDPSWSFYAKVIKSRSKKRKQNKSSSFLKNNVAPTSNSVPV